MKNMLKHLFGIPLLIAASCDAVAADSAHLLSFAEGRYAGFTRAAANDLLWNSERKKPIAIELAQHGDGLVLRWYVDGHFNAANVTGTLATGLTYREVDEVEDVNWRCVLASAQPAAKRMVRIGLSCAPDQPHADIAVALIALDIPTQRANDSMTVAISYYRPAASAPSQRISGKLTRISD
jgi:hypothetical protein